MFLGMDQTLKQYLANYQNPEAAKKDITRLITTCRSLNYRLEPYVFNDGTQVNLVNLNGTIPINFNGVLYNIPVCIWVLNTHPNHAPMCYVTPTPEMEIKESRFVDLNGKIYLPYLHDWDPKSSNLVALVEVMKCVFGESPPVYSKARTRENVVQQPTPFPPTQPVHMPVPSSFPSYSLYPPGPSSMPPHNQFQPPTNPPYPVNTAANPALPPFLPAQGQSTINEKHIRDSLLSALEHKVKRRLDDILMQSRAELQILQETARELGEGKLKISSIKDKLTKEKAELERNIALLKEKDIELDRALTEVSEGGEIDIDEAVTTTAPLYKQILQAYAEEAAIEDTLYHMRDALRAGVIDLDVFLKQVRTLSRQQFMLRALMQKCRQKAGLAG